MHAIVGGVPEDSGAQDRVQQIEAEVGRLSRLVTQLMAESGSRSETMGLPVGSHRYGSRLAAAPLSFDRARARMVREIIRDRRKREQRFSAHLLADPGWDMLLDLYAAHYEGQKVSISSLCIAASVPATTALRWMKTMEEDGHFVREHDPYDRRRVFIAISDDARARMDDYFDDIGG
ncbi:MarR family winged helix-turn-helix transcriptional regulator [Sphingopyxis sp.]|uniref:MarR family winged helix-turn-helix transcriptional regulator n=1 Tax=Sphingopyxis sp. TaxID=1908224 RepID=UPI002D76F56D|nr:MarR family winged helix-turn-helix transcriptional regulator [Sphingopyxis sp.]HET6526842.1 MarR family winged helix-turn-helix transcriptional regulator [Sphingopyxis sp.]